MIISNLKGTKEDNFELRLALIKGAFASVSLRTSADDAYLSLLAKGVSIYGTNATFGIGINAPTLTSSYSLTLPTSNGDDGQVMVTDGSGILSFKYPQVHPDTYTGITLASGENAVYAGEITFTIATGTGRLVVV